MGVNYVSACVRSIWDLTIIRISGDYGENTIDNIEAQRHEESDPSSAW